MDDFERELARMMRDTQDTNSLNDDQRTRLQSGVRKRRRTRAALLSGGSVAVIAGLAAALPSAFAAAPAGTAGHAATAASPAQAPSAAQGGGTAWMPGYVTQAFKALLPAGSSTRAFSAYGGVRLQTSAPSLSVSGSWRAALQTDLTTPGGRATTGLTVKASGPKADCPSDTGSAYDSCTTTSRAGGTVVVDKSFKNPVNGTGAAIWTVSWNGPHGQLVSFSEASDERRQALTVQQAVALVTAPAWDRVWQALPAPCQYGAMADPHAKPGTAGAGGPGLVCATSPSVAIHLPTTPATFTISSRATTPIDAATVRQILSSCLGSSASAYHSVIAVRTPVSSSDWDGAVIAVNSSGQYVQCETKGHRGTSQDNPPTFINDRMWSPGHLIEFFDSIGEPAGQGQYLTLGAGHFRSDVAKVTVSYGDDPTQYPTLMAGGAFFYTAAFATGTADPSTFMAPDPHLHAFDASGKALYNQ